MALADLSLLDFIPALSPEYRAAAKEKGDPDEGRPTHLREWCALIEQVLVRPVRALCSCPIRHYKTVTTLHGIVWLLLRDPTIRVLLLTFSHKRAQTLGKQLRQLAEAAGTGPAKGWDTIDEWRNEAGGGVVVMSADQSKLGYDCHVLFFDDALDENGWDDPLKRDEVDRTIVHYTARCQRGGKPGSVLGVGSRGHIDDPVGRRLARSEVTWDHIHYPAVITDRNGKRRAFAPFVWSLEALDAMRAEYRETDPTERFWFSQLMGDPRPDGSDKFGIPARHIECPPWSCRKIIGTDFAFSKAASADYFAAVVVWVYSSKAYMVECVRERLDPNTIENVLRGMRQRHQAPIFSYQSGPEIGLTNVLIERGVPVTRMLARYNKLVRAERTIKRWNLGNISVPEDSVAPWAKGFVHRAQLFRGRDGDPDDEIDALVSACDGGWGAHGWTTSTIRSPLLAGKV